MALRDLTITAPEKGALQLAERGRDAAGNPITIDRRLFMQLLVFTAVADTGPLLEALTATGLPAVLYADVNDPYGVGLLTFDEQPEIFVNDLRALINRPPFTALTPRPDMTMLGRTYAIGYESDLEHILLRRPIARVTDPKCPWAIWYPLRRSGHFEQLSSDEQRVILMEHGGIGRAYGEAGVASDVRLACHGLGTADNDFIVGLLGRDLYPLSRIIQRMRRTKQTSLYLERLGPFFIGKAIYQWRRPASENQANDSDE